MSWLTHGDCSPRLSPCVSSCCAAVLKHLPIRAGCGQIPLSQAEMQKLLTTAQQRAGEPEGLTHVSHSPSGTVSGNASASSPPSSLKNTTCPCRSIRAGLGSPRSQLQPEGEDTGLGDSSRAATPATGPPGCRTAVGRSTSGRGTVSGTPAPRAAGPGPGPLRRYLSLAPACPCCTGPACPPPSPRRGPGSPLSPSRRAPTGRDGGRGEGRRRRSPWQRRRVTSGSVTATRGSGSRKCGSGGAGWATCPTTRTSESGAAEGSEGRRRGREGGGGPATSAMRVSLPQL